MIVLIGIAMGFGYPLLVGAVILYVALLGHRAKLRRGTEMARSAIALGYSPDAVTELLLHRYNLPSMAVVLALASATGVRSSEALAIVLPHLKGSQRKGLARVPAWRFERRLDRFYPA